MKYVSFFDRLLRPAVNLLPGVDLPRRALLHRLHHAPVHHQRGQVPLAALPHEVRQEQVQAEGHPQDRVRVAAVHSHEPAAEPHVFEGMHSLTQLSLYVCSILTAL